MANVRISDLTSAAAALSTQQIEVNESGTSKKITNSQLLSYIEGEISTSPTFTGQVSIDDGTAVAPTLTNTGDTNTGIYFPAADTISFSTGGTLRGTFDASGNFVTTGSISTSSSISTSGSLTTTGAIELGNASDTTLARVSAGVASIEGKNIALNGTGEVLTTGTIELGHATDTTLSRVSAGVLAVEGQTLATLASPAFTGTPTAPTAAAGTNTTQLATTGFVAGNFLRQAIQSTWSTLGTIANVVGLLSWKNYGNNHVIFDASNSTSPSGGAVNNTNPDVTWTGTYPTLMGWNGVNTYGVRVDSSRYADYASSTSTASALNATAGANAGDVGTYAFLRIVTLSNVAAGTTHAASGLRYSNASGGSTGGTPSGTWRLMGDTGTGSISASTSLFLRIV